MLLRAKLAKIENDFDIDDDGVGEFLFCTNEVVYSKI